MDFNRLKQLAGLLNEAEAKLPIGLHFRISNPDNMRKAVDAILTAGLNVDLSFSMGVYYFNFKKEDIAEEAHSIASKAIDKKKEAKWSE